MHAYIQTYIHIHAPYTYNPTVCRHTIHIHNKLVRTRVAQKGMREDLYASESKGEKVNYVYIYTYVRTSDVIIR